MALRIILGISVAVLFIKAYAVHNKLLDPKYREAGLTLAHKHCQACDASTGDK